MQTSATPDAEVIDVPMAEPAVRTSVDEAMSLEGARGFAFGKYAVAYLHADKGWGHQEGSAVSKPLLALDRLYSNMRLSALRLVAGKHSIWLFL